MTRRRQTERRLSCALAAMLALAVALQVVRDRTFAYAACRRAGPLRQRSGEVMKRAALSYDALLADVYWIRALQHYGGERLKARQRRAASICCIRCSIWRRRSIRASPSAYRFGAIFLAEPQPGGAGRPDQAIALLKKGVAFNPEQVGLLPRHRLHLLLEPPRLREGRGWFNRGGDLPGAPWWLKTYAAVMLTRGGDRQASRAMWTQIGQSEDSEWLRQTSQLRLAQLDALDQIDVLKRIVDEFTTRTGRARTIVGAARRRRALLPACPSIRPARRTCWIRRPARSALRRESPLWPLPTEPAAAPELKRRRRRCRR